MSSGKPTTKIVEISSADDKLPGPFVPAAAELDMPLEDAAKCVVPGGGATLAELPLATTEL